MQLSIIQQIILGAIQGISEWLPISSSGMITLIMANFYGITDLDFLTRSALWLHLGTSLSALIYFRKDVLKILKSTIYYRESHESVKKVLKFLIITTLISGVIGIGILLTINKFETDTNLTEKSITGFVAILLLFTGIIQLKIKKIGLRKEIDIKSSDSMLLGFVQGIATLPGISRSGITISSLLLKKFDDTTALRLSFLMSLPIVILGNLILNYHDFAKVYTGNSIYGILTSFIFGLLTIHLLMKLSKRINFGWFVLIIAVLMLVSLLI